MDTPGLFEQTMSIKDKRTNDIIMNTIKKCIDLEVTKIDHVYFVMSIQNGLNQQDLDAFDLFSQLFVGMQDKITIFISRAQQLTEEDQKEYIKQFESVPVLQKMYKAVGNRIFFVGAMQQRSKMTN